MCPCTTDLGGAGLQFDTETIPVALNGISPTAEQRQQQSFHFTFFTKSWQTEANSVPKAQLPCQAPQSRFVHKANLILEDVPNLH